MKRECPACHRVVADVEDHHGWCVEGLREVASETGIGGALDRLRGVAQRLRLGQSLSAAAEADAVHTSVCEIEAWLADVQVGDAFEVDGTPMEVVERDGDHCRLAGGERELCCAVAALGQYPRVRAL